MTNTLHHQAGLLLIEVLLSILIFSFGILGLVALQAVSTQNSANAEYRSIAANLVSDIVSQTWIRKTTNIADANLSADIAAWEKKVAASGLPNGLGSVVEAGTVLTVTVQWKPPSKKSTDNVNQYQTQIPR